MNTGEFYESLSIDLNKLLTTCDDYNVIIGVGNNDDYKKFQAHSCILRARSPYFHSALSKGWVKRNEEGMILFEKSNIKPKIFECILEYIYSGVIKLDEYESMFIIDLIIASDELILTELCKYAQEYLLDNRNDWISSNPIEILNNSTVFYLESCKELINYCLEILCDDLLFILQNCGKKINEQILVEILKRDEIQLDEMSLLKCVIIWGIEKINNTKLLNGDKNILNLDVTKWIKKDFIDLEIILENCIPLIRTDLISHRELPTELQPFERMLIKNDCPNNQLSISRIPLVDPIDSVIIKWKHAALISKWINRQEHTKRLCRKESYNFRLLLRGTRDGFTSQKFHELCDNKGATIVLMRVANTNQIIGGYNPVSWQGGLFGKWIKTSDSFIFNIGEGIDLNQAVLSRIHQDHYSMALFCADVRGPSFGCHDLWMPNFSNLSLKCTSRHSYYVNQIIDTTKFNVEEYEVFQVFDVRK
ncbi:hypothetical protein RclHR1_04700005 [Rhizophagus clarus]|uniref:BTB domain-containing protein n=1 Tax=Rhizophagus clarus TaxID=94130 RepID=A0A2Z6RNU5_9GLOM|nr:hypothetical protein RclHR1_04700005 [Rhizophagus clarus]GES86452.1 hypothetical protein GLOIN_2v1658353 [Rhizophagus clarus]